MIRLEQINQLKKYKEILVYATGYESEEDLKQKELKIKEPQKVLILKRNLHGKSIRVA